MQYVVDIDKGKLSVGVIDQETIEDELDFFEVESIKRLQEVDCNRLFFESIASAEKFIEQHLASMKLLGESFFKVHCTSKITLTMKRRYLALILSGKKKCTYRTHNRFNLKVGDVTYFNDQYNFLRVKIKKISQETLNDGRSYYRYDFEMI